MKKICAKIKKFAISSAEEHREEQKPNKGMAWENLCKRKFRVTTRKIKGQYFAMYPGCVGGGVSRQIQLILLSLKEH